MNKNQLLSLLVGHWK